MTYLQAFSPLQTSRSALRVTPSLHVRPVGELLPCSSLPTAQLRLGGVHPHCRGQGQCYPPTWRDFCLSQNNSSTFKITLFFEKLGAFHESRPYPARQVGGTSLSSLGSRAAKASKCCPRQDTGVWELPDSGKRLLVPFQGLCLF